MKHGTRPQLLTPARRAEGRLPGPPVRSGGAVPGARRSAVALAGAVLGLVLLAACPGGGGTGGGGGPDSLAACREMVLIPGMTVTGAAASGAFTAGRVVTLSAFTIATYETTWALWDDVAAWNAAEAKGYVFTTRALKGSDDKGGVMQPVTLVSWRDVVVWCNAYSEKSGKTPAYYSDADYAEVIKSLTDDTVYVKPGADGYRLPTEAEWEAAARGGDPGDTASWDSVYAGGDTPDAVAWYHGNSARASHTVGTKAPNSAGLYDMSGNVWEWCFDWYSPTPGTATTTPAVTAPAPGMLPATAAVTDIAPGTDTTIEPVIDPSGPATGTHRTGLGGSWSLPASYCAVAQARLRAPPDFRDSYIGFRVVCAPAAP